MYKFHRVFMSMSHKEQKKPSRLAAWVGGLAVVCACQAEAACVVVGDLSDPPEPAPRIPFEDHRQVDEEFLARVEPWLERAAAIREVHSHCEKRGDETRYFDEKRLVRSLWAVDELKLSREVFYSNGKRLLAISIDRELRIVEYYEDGERILQEVERRPWNGLSEIHFYVTSSE